MLLWNGSVWLCLHTESIFQTAGYLGQSYSEYFSSALLKGEMMASSLYLGRDSPGQEYQCTHLPNKHKDMHTYVHTVKKANKAEAVPRPTMHGYHQKRYLLSRVFYSWAIWTASFYPTTVWMGLARSTWDTRSVEQLGQDSSSPPSEPSSKGCSTISCAGVTPSETCSLRSDDTGLQTH